MQQPLENFSRCLHAAQSLVDHPEPEIPAISSSSCISPDLHTFSSHFDAPHFIQAAQPFNIRNRCSSYSWRILGGIFFLHGQDTQLTLSSCQIASPLPPLKSLPQLKQAQKRPVSMSRTDPESNHQLGFCLQFGSNSLDHFTIHALLLMDNTSSSHAPHIVSRSLLTDLQLPPDNPPAIADHRSCKKSRVIPRLVVRAKTRA
jgi:hypothetical protein